MKLTMIDVLCIGVLFYLGGVLGERAARLLLGSSSSVTFLICGVGAVLVIGSFIYQRLRFLPLLFPVCPNCNRRPSIVKQLGGSWPRVEFECGMCARPFIALFSGKLEEPAGLPVTRLLWPQLVGFWRRAQPRGSDQ
jgi:hypothetical protein